MRSNVNKYALVTAAMAVGLVASACNGSNSAPQTSAATSATSASAAAASPTPQATAATPTVDSSQLPSLVPTPANSQPVNGPDTIADNGIHLHFQVNGSPTDVMNAYKAALESKSWSLTPISSSGGGGGGGGGGGATYTGTHGDVYGVFDGGGFNTTTYIDVCAWPSKPSNPDCVRGDR